MTPAIMAITRPFTPASRPKYRETISCGTTTWKRPASSSAGPRRGSTKPSQRRPKLANQLVSRDVGQAEVAQHHVEPLRGDEVGRLPPVGRRCDVGALGPEEKRENLADVLGVFDHEDANTPEPHRNPCVGQI